MGVRGFTIKRGHNEKNHATSPVFVTQRIMTKTAPQCLPVLRVRAEGVFAVDGLCHKKHGMLRGFFQ